MISRRFALHMLAGVSYVTSQTKTDVDDSYVYKIDTYDGIQYDRSWGPAMTGDATQRFNHTYTQSQVYGSQLWFAFRGNAITYYADKNPGSGAVTLSIDGSNNKNPTWTNVSPGVLYQQTIWASVELGEGDHTIVISNTNVNNASIGLDKFSVLSYGNDTRPLGYGPGASNVTPGAIVVDDASNEIKFWGTEWDSYSNDIRSFIQGYYFAGSQHCTNTPGANATFDFVGTAVWYFADRSSANSNVSLSIDGKQGVVVDTATPNATWTTQKLWWGVEGLSPEHHTLTLTHVGTPEKYACVDFFMYLPSSGVTSAPSPTSTSTSTTPLASSKSAPVGGIAGGIVGGLLAIIVLVILAVLLRRRKSRKSGHEAHHETYTGDAAYHSKQINPPYYTNNLGPAPSVTYSQHANMGGGGISTPTNWRGLTYSGYPEPQ